MYKQDPLLGTDPTRFYCLLWVFTMIISHTCPLTWCDASDIRVMLLLFNIGATYTFIVNKFNYANARRHLVELYTYHKQGAINGLREVLGGPLPRLHYMAD